MFSSYDMTVCLKPEQEDNRAHVYLFHLFGPNDKTNCFIKLVFLVVSLRKTQYD